MHQALRQKGPVTVPREFVLMDRAAIGLGGVFLHLRAELNFHRLFEEAMEDFSVKARGGAAGGGAQARRPRPSHADVVSDLSTAIRTVCGIRHVGLPAGIRLMGRGFRSALRVPAAAIPLGLPLRSIQTERDLMLVRLGCCVVLAVAVLAPHGARADCAEEISQLMSKDTEKLTTRYKRVTKQIQQKGASAEAASPRSAASPASSGRGWRISSPR